MGEDAAVQVPVFRHLSARRITGKSRQQDHHHHDVERIDDLQLLAVVSNGGGFVGHGLGLPLSDHEGAVVRWDEFADVGLARREDAERFRGNHPTVLRFRVVLALDFLNVEGTVLALALDDGHMDCSGGSELGHGYSFCHDELLNYIIHHDKKQEKDRNQLTSGHLLNLVSVSPDLPL